MAAILAPQFGREVLRCDYCDLVQFTTDKRLCRRCHQPYRCADSTHPAIIHGTTANSGSEPQSVRTRVALNVIAHRRSKGLTQLELGRRMNVARTYISKIEGRKVTPTLSSLDRLARALGTSPAALASPPRDSGQEYLSDLRRDPFLDQIARSVSRLTPAQRSRLLDFARRLAEHRNRKLLFRTIASCEEKQCFSTPRCSTSSPDAASKISTRF